MGEFLYYEDKFDEADKALTRAVELGRGSGDEAPQVLAAFLYASRGQRDRIDPLVFRARPEQTFDGDAAYWQGGIYAMLGDKDRAFALLDRAYAEKDWMLRDVKVSPIWDPLRKDPRFSRLLSQMRLG